MAHRVGALDWLSEGLSRIGSLGLVWLAVALILALARRRAEIFVLVLAADALADLSATGLKIAIPRHRPRLPTLGSAPHDHSFPSGHAATSFACATVLTSFFPRRWPAFYALAALIALSRLYNGVHFPLDVIGGGALGALLATALLRLAAARRQRRQGSRAS